MSEVEELEKRIQNLPREAMAEFRNWFYEFDQQLWDRQIAADYKAGKLDKLINQARQEFAEGQVREL